MQTLDRRVGQSILITDSKRPTVGLANCCGFEPKNRYVGLMILGTRDTERPTIGLEALPTFESLQSDIRWFLRLIDSLVGFWSLVRTFGLKRAFLRHFPISNSILRR